MFLSLLKSLPSLSKLIRYNLIRCLFCFPERIKDFQIADSVFHILDDRRFLSYSFRRLLRSVC